MRIGVKFSRLGFSKYISHLDMQRLFGRAIMRAGIPAKYSEGFNPHMNLSFASPLAVGLESVGDYFEFYADECVLVRDAQERLNQALPDGFQIVNMGILTEGSGKLMAVTMQAGYEVCFEDAAFLTWLLEVMGGSKYMLSRVRKGKAQVLDIRPLIHQCEVDGNKAVLRLENSGRASLSPLHLLREASDVTGKQQFARVVRQELYTVKDDTVLPLDALWR